MSKQIQYPEHEKLFGISERSQEIGNFIENCGYVLAEYDEDDRLRPVMLTTEQVLAKYFGIDLKLIEQEKEQMLEEVRRMNL